MLNKIRNYNIYQAYSEYINFHIKPNKFAILVGAVAFCILIGLNYGLMWVLQKLDLISPENAAFIQAATIPGISIFSVFISNGYLVFTRTHPKLREFLVKEQFGKPIHLVYPEIEVNGDSKFRRTHRENADGRENSVEFEIEMKRCISCHDMQAIAHVNTALSKTSKQQIDIIPDSKYRKGLADLIIHFGIYTNTISVGSLKSTSNDCILRTSKNTSKQTKHDYIEEISISCNDSTGTYTIMSPINNKEYLGLVSFYETESGYRRIMIGGLGAKGTLAAGKWFSQNLTEPDFATGAVPFVYVISSKTDINYGEPHLVGKFTRNSTEEDMTKLSSYTNQT